MLPPNRLFGLFGLSGYLVERNKPDQPDTLLYVDISK
jgi:hypothetical protein